MTAPLDIELLVQSLLAAERQVVSRLLTWAESSLPDHRLKVDEVLARVAVVPRESGATTRIGITGAPGVGKSTLLEKLGTELVERGWKVAVMTIDPTSPISGGSLLGDKTRMTRLSAHPLAFVRPAPSSNLPGGLGRATARCLDIFDAAGFQYVFVETTGVGQGETDVWPLVDALVVLVDPAAGDELQGMKRGLMERADLLAITKGDLHAASATTTRALFAGALNIVRGEAPPVLVVDGMTGSGVSELWEAISSTAATIIAQGRRQAASRNVREQAFWDQLQQELRLAFQGVAQKDPGGEFASILADVRGGEGTVDKSVARALRTLLGEPSAPR